MELSENEVKLIEAVRALNESPRNMILFYANMHEVYAEKLASFDASYVSKVLQPKVELANKLHKEW